MGTIIAIFTTVLLSGAVLDVLTDGLGLARTARGHVVQHREATLVLRGDDQRVYTINTAGLDLPAMTRLKEGRPVTVALKSGSGPAVMPIAASVTAGPGAAKTFRRVEGFVEAVNGDRVTFKTRDGLTLTLDRSRIVGEAPRVAVNETATLVYEQEPALAGVWIDTREIQPAAAVAAGAYQRLHGHVQAVGLGSLMLKTDRGAVVTVDTTQVGEPVRVRPGDFVTIVGKTAEGHAERFVAEVIQTDTVSAPAGR